MALAGRTPMMLSRRAQWRNTIMLTARHVGTNPWLAIILRDLLVRTMAEVLRKGFVALVNDFAALVVRNPFEVPIIVPIDYALEMHKLLEFPAVVRDGL